MDWDQLKDLFAACEGVPDEGLADFLSAQGVESSQATEVIRLVRQSRRAGEFMERPLVAPPPAASNETPDAPFESGHVIAHRFVISEFIGAGGMGEVYRAFDQKLHRYVAVKILRASTAESADVRERRSRSLLREARAVSAINHPNVAHLYEMGDDVGFSFIAMELVEGESIKNKLAGGPLSPGEVLSYATQIADGLREAHRRGVVHRDIKPGNVLVTASGVVKIVDFGIATRQETGGLHADGTLTDERFIPGTVQYMSPEQALGHPVDARSDLFSFGSLLYEMCTGRPPFAGSTQSQTVDAILHAEVPRIPRARRELAAVQPILDRCLEKDKGQRYASASELRDDLQRLATRGGSIGWSWSGLTKRWTVLPRSVAVVLAGMALAAVLVIYMTKGKPASRDLPVASPKEASTTATTEEPPRKVPSVVSSGDAARTKASESRPEPRADSPGAKPVGRASLEPTPAPRLEPRPPAVEEPGLLSQTAREVSNPVSAAGNSPPVLGTPPPPKDDILVPGPATLPPIRSLTVSPAAPPPALVASTGEPKPADPGLLAQAEAKRQVLAVLDRYATAATRRQVKEMVSVRPSLSTQEQRKLQRGFTDMADFQMTIVPLGEPKFLGLDRSNGATASISCRVISRSKYQGEKDFSTSTEEVTIDLEYKNGAWTIRSIR